MGKLEIAIEKLKKAIKSYPTDTIKEVLIQEYKKRVSDIEESLDYLSDELQTRISKKEFLEFNEQLIAIMDENP